MLYHGAAGGAHTRNFTPTGLGCGVTVTQQLEGAHPGFSRHGREVQVKKLVALALAVMLMVLLTACGGAAKSDDTAAMPASSSDLKGEDYQDRKSVV